jgi:parvulin-like peptidyl-prolyl isomerase
MLRPLGFAILLLALSGCEGFLTSSASLSTTEAVVTPLPPTSTPAPMAALVNGEPLILDAYQSELVRFEAAQQALGIDLATIEDYQSAVLQALIERKLLAQGARRQGFTLDAADVEAQIADLQEQMGGEEAFQAWLQENDYSLESFRTALAEETMANQMIQTLAAAVPTSETQVHARHILVHTSEEAEDARAEILAGTDFGDLAASISLDLSTRPAGGDLGWFARGVLTTPELEEAAFSLPAGELSEVIESALGYHILEVLAREDRPLPWDVLQLRQQQAVEAWLLAQRETAQIEIYVADQP